MFTKKNGVEGILFKDGTFISLDDLEIENLTASQRKELEDLHLYNELAIRKRLHDLGGYIQILSSKMDENFTSIIEKLNRAESEGFILKQNCPVNVERIQTIAVNSLKTKQAHEILEKKWLDIFKERIITAGNIAKALTAIMLLFGLFLAIIEAVK